jgi:hypothetical protein
VRPQNVASGKVLSTMQTNMRPVMAHLSNNPLMHHILVLVFVYRWWCDSSGLELNTKVSSCSLILLRLVGVIYSLFAMAFLIQD